MFLPSVAILLWVWQSLRPPRHPDWWGGHLRRRRSKQRERRRAGTAPVLSFTRRDGTCRAALGHALTGPKVFQVPGEPVAVHTQPTLPPAAGVRLNTMSPCCQSPEAGAAEPYSMRLPCSCTPR